MPESSKLLEQLLDDDAELDDLKLDQLPVKDLVEAIVFLRARVFMMTSVMNTLSEHMRLIDAFAKPKTRRFLYVYPRIHKIQ